MLEPMLTVEMEETSGAGCFVEGAVGERSEMPGAHAVSGGGPGRIRSSLSVRGAGGLAPSTRAPCASAQGSSRAGEKSRPMRRVGF
jgi:hypothetical protein